MTDAVAEPELAAPIASLPSPPNPLRTPSSPAQAPADGQRVYAMPQLVAIMHIRRHERTAKSRPAITLVSFVIRATRPRRTWWPTSVALIFIFV